MATFTSPTDVVAGSLARASDLNNLDSATAAAFALLPANANINAGTVNFAVDTGAANAYLVALPMTATSYTDGLSVTMRPLNANTGACTINVDSLGVKSIKTGDNTTPAAGDIVAGVPIELRYSSNTGFFHISRNSAASATAAAASAAAALVSENAASASASAASGSASSASSSASTATTQAGNASSSASAASSSATTATNYATKVDGYASGTDNSAKSWAVGGTSSGQPSAGDAKSWATQTTTPVSGTDYSSKEYAVGDATASGGSAKAWATDTSSPDGTAEKSAKTLAGEAASSALSASGSASSASGSASTATTQAGIATTQASNAAVSAAAALASENNAAASYDSFDDRYLGAKASDPTLDNDGNALLTGALYFNTGTNLMRVYNGAAWQDVVLTTPVAVTGGGTGRTTLTTAYGLLAAGTTATGAVQTLAAGATTEILVGGGASALPAWTTATGSGAPVRATSPTLVTPTLGVAAATSVNKVAITAPATGSTLTIADGKTLTASNTITLTATDGSTLAIGTGGTLGTAAYTAATAYDAAGAAAAVTPTTLGLVIGTNVQAYDADLTTWAGVTPGTGVATALAVNVGSAGAPVVNGGALGTPSSGTLTNCTGLPGSGVAGSLQTIWIPATAMISRTTTGAAAGTVEKATNKNMFKTLDFDTAADEHAQFMIQMPKSWNEGTVTFVPVWSHAATTTNFGVAWFLQGIAISNDDAGDVAFGTAQSSIDTGGTTDDIYIGPASSAITIGGTPAANDYVMFQIYRDVSDGGDTMAIDARLHGIQVYYTTDAGTDA